MVPASFSGAHAPVPRRDYVERQHGSTAPFMVIDTDIWPSGMPANSVRMS